MLVFFHQILYIINHKLKQKYFSLTIIFNNIKKCHLQSNNLEKMIFVNTNWPSNPKVGCKSLFNLVESIENDLGLEKKNQGLFE